MRPQAAILATFVALLVPAPTRAGMEAEVEGGFVLTGRNDTRIPGNTGTDLSLVRDLSTAPASAFRVRVGYRIANRHLVTALYAPLQLACSRAVPTTTRSTASLGSITW